MRLIAIAICVLVLVAGWAVAGVAAVPEFSSQAPATVPDFIVYYFHNHVRCQTCRGMESMTAETVDYDFMDALDQGLLVMRTVDVQDQGNEHFVQEFTLAGPTLVLVEQDEKGGLLRWKDLDRIWELSDKPVAFRAYVRESLTAFMQSEETGGGK